MTHLIEPPNGLYSARISPCLRSAERHRPNHSCLLLPTVCDAARSIRLVVLQPRENCYETCIGRPTRPVQHNLNIRTRMILIRQPCNADLSRSRLFTRSGWGSKLAQALGIGRTDPLAWSYHPLGLRERVRCSLDLHERRERDRQSGAVSSRQQMRKVYCHQQAL